MRNTICIAFSILHILALSVSTLIATAKIESILVTGIVCSLTGIAAGIASFYVRRFGMGIIALNTFAIAVALFILEAYFLHMGPQKAALPFSIVFLVNQILTNVILIRGIHQIATVGEAVRSTFTIRLLLVAMTAVAIGCAIAKSLPREGHLMPMILATILCVFTVAAILMVAARWMQNRVATNSPE